MNIKSSVKLAALCGALVATTVGAEVPDQASIPFANSGGIRDWHADGNRTLFIQDRQRQWYRATLVGGCTELPYAHGIGFETQSSGSFDRWSTIIVRDQRCAVQSLTEIDAPDVGSRPADR